MMEFGFWSSSSRYAHWPHLTRYWPKERHFTWASISTVFPPPHHSDGFSFSVSRRRVVESESIKSFWKQSVPLMERIGNIPVMVDRLWLADSMRLVCNSHWVPRTMKTQVPASRAYTLETDCIWQFCVLSTPQFLWLENKVNNSNNFMGLLRI